MDEALWIISAVSVSPKYYLARTIGSPSLALFSNGISWRIHDSHDVPGCFRCITFHTWHSDDREIKLIACY